MDLARQEYPALLTSLQPPQAAAVLNDRIRLINKVNVDIADWLQERRRVEELYIQGLRKLARRPLPEDSTSLGIFQLPWKRIITATESLAASHETLASKIEQDVEKPLREYASTNRELSSMPSIHNDLVNLSKSLDAAQKKLEKAKEKGSKGADKAIMASSSLAEATQQWESRAPYVFEQLQSVDESRLNHLRDVLTQLQTHEVDQVERSRQSAENCLNALLNVQTADEIKTFAAKISGGRESAPLRRSSSTAAPPPPPPPPSAPVSTAPVNTPPVDLPPPPRFQDDAASQHSSRSGRIGREPPPVPEPRHTPKLGGLRRLGTVMNRRKSIALGSGSSFTGQEKKSRTGFSFRRAETSRDVHTQLPSTPPGRDSPSIAGDSTASPTPISLRDPPVPEESTGITPIQEAIEPPVTTNGTTANLADRQHPQTTTAQPQVDSEGYTEKPSTVDEITRAQREAAGMEESGLNLTIRDQPIHEDEEQAKQAMDDIANTLRQQGLQSGIRRNAGTIRGRRDVRNTMFVASSGSPEPASAVSTGANLATSPENPLQKSPLLPAPNAPALSQEDRAMSDTTSIHSSHTLHSISGPVSHPELHDLGLNASVVETVNSWFEGGSVSKSFVVGELALAYNAAPGTTPESSTVRLENFALLEKVAANPHFVAEVSKTDDEKRGEYTVSLAKIARSIPTVAFKYQVHLPSTSISSYSPIIFTPAWNLEEFQASAIIPYKINPAFAAGKPTEPIILKNVVITVNLDLSPEDEVTKQPREVARATAAVMYPNTGAAFRRKQSAVVWKLPELEVKPDADNKLLVRFTTAVSWPRKGKVDTKFEYHTTDATSRLGISVADTETKGQAAKDPFADEGAGNSSTVEPSTEAAPAWKEVHTVRKLVAGKYVSS